MFPNRPSLGGSPPLPSTGRSSSLSVGQDDKQPILNNSQQQHHSGNLVGRDSELFETSHPHHSSEHIPESRFDPISTNYNPEVNMQRGVSSSIDKETVGKGTSKVFKGEPSADHERPPQFED
ncbi:predicted protein [Naegleria gruberi]|uniref:Predicted protein n=1 Tax=Naegleria gruberi TaxID=5762 RepID=D2VSZ1_NAEGR|nr:uncharacterized protein NAEGRDRAFT_72112 [Naegleria gruberi]EFC40062.1 predicted protein [Naegleria gruberi]|eukprot:XP_002672806.1 predicted protein [Naegleria gruberi strain NEG-M]